MARRLAMWRSGGAPRGGCLLSPFSLSFSYCFLKALLSFTRNLDEQNQSFLQRAVQQSTEHRAFLHLPCRCHAMATEDAPPTRHRNRNSPNLHHTTCVECPCYPYSTQHEAVLAEDVWMRLPNGKCARTLLAELSSLASAHNTQTEPCLLDSQMIAARAVFLCDSHFNTRGS